jgi:glycosyltransferase involved in cell wall biosynthesis
MRIAILTNTFPPDGRGGAEKIAWLQATGLASKKHDVRVWSPTSGQNTTTHNLQPTTQHVEVSRFRSRFHRLGRMNPLSRLLFHLFGDIRPRTDVVYEIVTWKPDVIISHNLTGCGIGTPSYVQKKGIRWIHIVHDIQLTEPSGQLLAIDARKPLKRAWRAFWARYRASMFFGRPDVLASPTEWLLAWHENYGFKGKKNVILPNPIDAGDGHVREVMKPGSILYVGRLSRDKGFDMFMEAIRLLEPEFVHSIVIIGDGPMEEEAKMLKDSRVECCGWREPDEVRVAIRNADILVAPSHILENQQTIILEAMAEGTPVIATDVGGTRETLKDTKCPIIPVTSNVPMEIAKNVNRLFEDKKAWRRISNAMRERAQRHDVEHYLDSLEKLIAKIRDIDNRVT